MSADNEGLAAVAALDRHVSRHLAHSYTIAHALGCEETIEIRANCHINKLFYEVDFYVHAIRFIRDKVICRLVCPLENSQN